MNGIVLGAENAGDLIHQLIRTVAEYDLLGIEIFQFSERMTQGGRGGVRVAVAAGGPGAFVGVQQHVGAAFEFGAGAGVGF